MKMVRWGPAGYSFVELLVAIGIASISTTVVGSAYVHFAEARQRSALISIAASLESALITGLLAPENFGSDTNTSIRTHMNSTSVVAPPGFTFQIQSPLGNFTNLQLGQTYGFNLAAERTDNRTITSCTGSDCTLRLRTDLRRENGRWAFAYAFELRHTDVNIVYVGGSDQERGQSLDSYVFTSQDYNIVVPFESYIPNLETSCIAGVHAGAIGYNKDLGQVNCVEAPLATDRCADGSIAKGVRLVSNGSGGFRMVFDCQPLAPGRCEQAMDYAASLVLPRQFDYTASVDLGDCTYASADQGSYSCELAGDRQYISSGTNVCPRHYVIQSVTPRPVALETIYGDQGDCMTYCWRGNYLGGAPYVQNFPSAPSGSPPTTVQVPWNYIDWSFNCDPAWEGGPGRGYNGRAPTAAVSVSGNSFTMTVTPANQQCGARWFGYVTVDISCVLSPARPDINLVR